MQKESQLRTLSERVLQATLATLPRRPLPVSAHQAASELYDVLDRYTDAVLHNQLNGARLAAEQLAVEAMRLVYGYTLPAMPTGVDTVKVQTATKVSAPESTKKPSNVHAS